MIITLVKADFSANNIGTLSSVAIITNILNGVYSGPSSVEKGNSFSATIALNEGFVLPTTGISITMGGIALTNVYTVENGVVTINISEVTGIIVIDMNPEAAPALRVYAIGETLAFNDMEEVAPTFIEESYYTASDTTNPGSVLKIETRSGYKAWKNIPIYAGESYQLNADMRAITFYDEYENIIDAFNLKNTYSNGIIPADRITRNCWMSVTAPTSKTNDVCTITRVS